MEGRVTSNIATGVTGRSETGRGTLRLGPDSGSASGRIAVTKADEGVAPTSRGAAHIGTPTSSPGNVGIADLTHDQVRNQFSDYLDDSLGEAARRRIDSHLAACASCTAYLDTFRLTVQSLGRLTAPKAPDGVRSRIVEQARREDRAPTERA